LSVLGIGREALAPLPVHNAVTSRVKTLIPIDDRERLNKLVTSASDVEAVCRRIGSTGLYPYSTLDAEARTFEARQFLAPPAIPKTQRPESQRLRWSSDYLMTDRSLRMTVSSVFCKAAPAAFAKDPVLKASVMNQTGARRR
jgi:hypothetical protein